VVGVLVLLVLAVIARTFTDASAPPAGDRSVSASAPEATATASANPPAHTAPSQRQTTTAPDTDAQLRQLFETQQSDVQVSGAGTVSRVLGDDNEGDRHQRFILRLASGQTLLVAHNIDIAPRLDGLAAGDKVAFSGVYVYTDQGGTIHWTHHDPSGTHVAGWLEWNGKKYS